MKQLNFTYIFGAGASTGTERKKGLPITASPREK